jgi:hypothetical protein
MPGKGAGSKTGSVEQDDIRLSQRRLSAVGHHHKLASTACAADILY